MTKLDFKCNWPHPPQRVHTLDTIEFDCQHNEDQGSKTQNTWSYYVFAFKFYCDNATWKPLLRLVVMSQCQQVVF